MARAEIDDPVEAGRQALAKHSQYPWYDAARDDIRTVAVRPPPPPPEPAHPDWEWAPASNTAPNWNWNWSGWGTGWQTGFEVFVVILLSALFIFLLVMLIRSFLAGDANTEADAAEGENIEEGNAPDRIEELPVQIRRGQGNLLDEARRHYEAGRYNEAIIYLYSYELVELDRRQHLRLSKGKTNRQYLREIRGQVSLAGVLERSMVAFEDVFFGHHELQRERFEQCWQEVDQFHAWLQGAPA